MDVYGSTECGIISYLPSRDSRRKTACVGIACSNSQFRIVDDEGRDVPQGNVGEIISKSPQLARGYYNKSDLTREAWKDGWFYTGDMGRFMVLYRRYGKV